MRLLLPLITMIALAEEAQAPKPIPIPDDFRYRYALLQKEAEILELQACFSQGWKREKCNIDWKNGLMGERK